MYSTPLPPDCLSLVSVGEWAAAVTDPALTKYGRVQRRRTYRKSRGGPPPLWLQTGLVTFLRIRTLLTATVLRIWTLFSVTVLDVRILLQTTALCVKVVLALLCAGVSLPITFMCVRILLTILCVVHFLLGCSTWFPGGWVTRSFQRWDS